MQSQDVVRQSQEFLRLMSDVTPKSDLAFETFTRDGLEDLCEFADEVALGRGASVSSLTIRPGDENSFVIHGTHARATLESKNTGARLILCLLIIVVLLALLACVRRT